MKWDKIKYRVVSYAILSVKERGFLSMKLNDPLFLDVDFLNIHEKDKGSPSISVRVNLQRDDIIYVCNVKHRMEVMSYVDPDTGLFVASTEDTEQESIYHRFRLMAVCYAKEKLDKFLSDLGRLSEEEYHKRNLKPFPLLQKELRSCLKDRQALYADLQKQVNLITSRKIPKVNEFMVFSDDKEIAYPVTARAPYTNPSHVVLTKEERAECDKFLDVFFDKYNKFAFSWYMGAALSNIPVYDDRVSKLAILSSSLGGSGKSTLVTAMVNALFTSHYRDIKDDFDSFFAMNNRFGTGSLSTKRMCVYSEASFNADPLSEEHNFTGMNVSAIKSMITEGYISAEAKFGDRNMERLSGFHLVLTNHPPMITSANQAMNRRILPIMLKPTSMADKARELKLWGRHTLDTYVSTHAREFATYFVDVFRSDEYAFTESEYNYTDYQTDIKNSQSDLNEEQMEGRKTLDSLKASNFLDFLSEVERLHHLNLSLLRSDVMAVTGGGSKKEFEEHVRIDNGKLYLDGSKSFLLRYGTTSLTLLRQILKEYYGEPVRKFHMRMFEIPMNH